MQSTMVSVNSVVPEEIDIFLLEIEAVSLFR